MSVSSPFPRLLLVAHRFQKNDGQGRVNYEVVKALLEQGYRLTLLTSHCEQDIARHPGARVVFIGRENLPTQLLRNLAFATQSARWIRKHRADFDLVQANGFITWAPCDIVTAHFVHTAWAKNPYYPYARSKNPQALYQRLFTSLNARWERRAFGSARTVIAVSDVVASDVAALGIPADHIKVIHNGVDTAEFAPGQADREHFSLPQHVPMALFVGDIKSPRKNLATLLRAASRIPDLHLAVAGAKEGSSAPEQARELGLQQRVHFVGKTKQVAALMRSADLFVFPSRYESFGLVVFEAIASGLPTIISRNVESSSVLGGAAVILRDPDDVDELVAAITGLLGSPARRAELAAAARQRALDFDWSKTAAAYQRVYELLAANMASG